MTKCWERIILQRTKNEELRMKNRNKNNDMKKGFQWMALLVVAMLGACSGGSDKAAAEKVDEKPRVKLAEVSSRPVEQIQEYTATVEAEVKNNIAPSSPVRIKRLRPSSLPSWASS